MNRRIKITYKNTILGLLVVMLFVAVIEYSIQIIYEPNIWERSSWLLHDPYKGEPFDRLVLREKLEAMDSSNPEIITVGDSSGFFSLHPGVMNKYLNGLKVANISTGANQAFDGYFADAKYMLKKNKNIKYVVLYLHPNLIPTPKVIEKGDLGPIVEEQLISYRGKLSSPPSAMFSRSLKTKIFTGYETSRYDTLSSHLVYLQFNKTASITSGWVPEHDIRYPRFNGTPVFFPDKETELVRKYSFQQLKVMLRIRDESTINYYLSQFADLCRQHGVVPIIAFNTMPWTVTLLTPEAAEGMKELERFSRENPDVHFATPYITIWGSEKFGSFNHVSREYVHLSSARLGLSLNNVIQHINLRHHYRQGDFRETNNEPPKIKRSSPASQEEKEAALAYYLYMSTGDKTQYEKLSTRVKNMLGNEPGFKEYLAALNDRNNYMQNDKTAMQLGYEIAGLQADVVEIEGLSHCSKDESMKWIRISGTMNFTLKSKLNNVSESTAWPINSDIVFPIILENKRAKFDGYCKEDFNTD